MSFGRLLTAAAILTIAGATSATAAPMVLMNGTTETNRKIISPGAADALPADGRLYVPGSTPGALFAGEADKPYRVDNVLAAELVKRRTGPKMAAFLRGRIDGNACVFSWGRVDCRSGLVFVDEIDYRFAEKAPNLTTPAWKTRPGRKLPTYRPQGKPGQPGYELTRAMAILAATPYRDGGTYAERVHFFIAPGVVSSVGVGRGPDHNLGRDGRPHYRSHQGVRGALQRAGGVWLEMYHFDHGPRGMYAFTTAEWQAYPHRFALYLSGRGQTRVVPRLRSKMRFHVVGYKPQVKAGAPAACRTGSAMTCVFTLASSSKNAPILANGVGQYKMEGHEAEFRAQIKRRFFPELTTAER